MQKNRFSLVLIAILLSLSLVLTFGCAKKAAVTETQAPAKKAETDARDKAAREAQLRDQERAAAEKERAKPAEAAVSPIAAFEYIYFDFDKFAIKSESREALKKLADWLGANKNAKLLIEGNCDERGTVEYNLALGERRAAAARDYLTTLGVAKDRLSTVSYGKEKPVDPGHNEEAWAKNRNDHFVVK